MLVLTFISGGFLYSVYVGAPFMAWAIFSLISIVLLSVSREPQVVKHDFSVISYLKHMKDGVLTIFSKRLILYTIPILGITMFISINQGVVRTSLGAYFGFNGETFGYLLGVASIPAAYIAFHLDTIQKKIGEKNLLLLGMGTYIGAFIVGYFNKELLNGIIMFLLLTITEKIARPFVSVLLNERIHSKHRATALFSDGFVSELPYVVLMIGLSSIVEPKNIPILITIMCGYMTVLFIYTLLTFRSSGGISNKNQNAI